MNVKGRKIVKEKNERKDGDQKEKRRMEGEVKGRGAGLARFPSPLKNSISGII